MIKFNSFQLLLEIMMIHLYKIPESDQEKFLAAQDQIYLFMGRFGAAFLEKEAAKC